MSDLSATAERLRVVKDACIDFITLWAIDQLMAEDRHSDRIHGDMVNSSEVLVKKEFSLMHVNRRMVD
jgi:hypothetical protein